MIEPVIALDLGGTTVVGAVVDGAARVAVRLQAPTPVTEGPEAVMEALIALARRLRDASPESDDTQP
jgi:predicted NBD/HSP70 family sugar kinase